MKKIFCLLLTVLICTILLVSCAKSHKDTVYIISTSAGDELSIGASMINTSIASEFGPSIFYDNQASETTQVTVMGTTYNGHYVYSDRGVGSTLIRDRYDDDAGNNFTVIRSNGKLAGFYKFLEHDETSPIACTMDEGREIATDFLKNITDIENYTLTSTRIVSGVAEDSVCEYNYKFVRMLGEYETSDVIYIYVDCRRACVNNYYCYSIGELENASLPDTFDLDSALNTLCTGTREMWNDIQPFSDSDTATQPLTFQAQSDNYMLVKTSDGHLALSATVVVSGIGDDGRSEALGAIMIID